MRYCWPLPLTGLTTRFCNRPSLRMLAASPSRLLRSIALRGLPRPGSSDDKDTVCIVMGRLVENRRVSGERAVQRQVLYLGEINDGQKAAWCRTIKAFDEAGQDPRQIALFPEDRPAPVLDCDVVHVRLSGLRLHRPRQWGACWLACHLWDQLRLDDFWSPRLPTSRQGTRWLNVLKTLVTYRLVDPGSEWRLHRQWYAQNAIGDL